MFLSDPNLRLIAARTGDVWPVHQWRYHTDDPEPFGDLSRHLHKLTLMFNDSTNLFGRLLNVSRR